MHGLGIYSFLHFGYYVGWVEKRLLSTEKSTREYDKKGLKAKTISYEIASYHHMKMFRATQKTTQFFIQKIYNSPTQIL